MLPPIELQTALRTGGVFFSGDQAFLSLGDRNVSKGHYLRVQGGRVWPATLDSTLSSISAKRPLRLDPTYYFLRPLRHHVHYGIARRTDAKADADINTDEPILQIEFTRQVFGMERKSLQQLLTAYAKALRINFADFGHRDHIDPLERLSCSTSSNRCDLSGALIPAGFPYLSLTLHHYWSNHTSFAAFYDHVNLVTCNGDKRCVSTQLMNAQGMTDEIWNLLRHPRIHEARNLVPFDHGS